MQRFALVYEIKCVKFVLSPFLNRVFFKKERTCIFTNSIDPDQMPPFMASVVGSHRLPVSLLWDARHKLVKVEQN